MQYAENIAAVDPTNLSRWLKVPALTSEAIRWAVDRNKLNASLTRVLAAIAVGAGGMLPLDKTPVQIGTAELARKLGLTDLYIRSITAKLYSEGYFSSVKSIRRYNEKTGCHDEVTVEYRLSPLLLYIARLNDLMRKEATGRLTRETMQEFAVLEAESNRISDEARYREPRPEADLGRRGIRIRQLRALTAIARKKAIAAYIAGDRPAGDRLTRISRYLEKRLTAGVALCRPK